jgi:chromosome partitioning protein
MVATPTMNTSIVVAVLNQKGGVGKSMVAQHLAAAAHLAGRRVLLIDLDTQGTSFRWFAARGETSLLAGLTVVKADEPLKLSQFRQLSRTFDFVVCDGPARLADVSVGAAVAADVVLVPMKVGQGEWWSDIETQKTLDIADGMRASIDRPPVRRFYVLNELVPNLGKNQHMIDALAAEGRAELLPVTLHKRAAFEKGLTTGETALTLEPRSAAAREIKTLYRLVMERRDAA